VSPIASFSFGLFQETASDGYSDGVFRSEMRIKQIHIREFNRIGFILIDIVVWKAA
jgi:hypothetical protein